MVEKKEVHFQNQEIRIFAAGEVVKYERINLPILDTISNRSDDSKGDNYVTGSGPFENTYKEEAHDDAATLAILKLPNPEHCPLTMMGMIWDESTTLMDVLDQVKDEHFLIDNKL